MSNKIGSLAAAICTKKLNPSAKVVVVSDADKIVAPKTGKVDPEIHPHHEVTSSWGDETRRSLENRVKQGHVEVFGEWFEWVSSAYIDTYITESGVIDKWGVWKIAEEIRVLEKKIFR